MIGQVIGNYKIMELIGSGGFGTVYRAHDIEAARDMAMKVILPNYTKQAEFKQSFATEAEAIACLDHPHLVPLKQYWQDESGSYLLMPYIQGTNLRTILDHQGAIALNQILRVLAQITDALEIAHQASILHCNLKPDNVLLDQRGNAYLADFAIAKDLNRSAYTMTYLSPEQVRKDTVSPQSDVYSLGIILYEMLLGEHPFTNSNQTAPRVADKRRDLPSAVDTILQKATEKDPQERFASVRDLLLAFQQAIQDRSESKKSSLGTSQEERQRSQMIQNVYTYWVEGVLEHSLSDTLVQLDMLADQSKVTQPWDALLHTSDSDSDDSEVYNDSSIIDMFDKSNGKLLILGSPGSGKTTALLELTKELLNRAKGDSQHPIPVIFNLSSWALMHKPLDIWLEDEFVNVYHIPRNIAQQWIEQDQLLLLLDGLDEVPEAYRRQCTSAINVFRRTHAFVDIVVCSRIAEYNMLSNQLMLNAGILLQPLSDEQINEYINRLGDKVEGLREVLQRDEALRDMCRTPFILVMTITAYQGWSPKKIQSFETDKERHNHLFASYTQRMLSRNPENAKYSSKEIRNYLIYIAQKLVSMSRTIFLVETMQPIWLSDDLRIKTIKMADRITSILIFITNAILLFLVFKFYTWVFIPIIFFISFWYLSYNISSFGIYLGYDVVWRFERRFWLILLAVLIIGSLMHSIVGGIITTIATSLMIGLTTSSEAKIRPRTQAGDALRQSIVATMQISGICGLIVLVAASLLYTPLSGIVAGLCAFIFAALMIANFRAIMLHMILRWFLMKRGEAPFNYESFLADAVNLAFMRKVGGGHLFIHRYLLEYFADLEMENT